MGEPIILSDEEAEALLGFFQFLYLPYDDKRMPLHRLLNRIEARERIRIDVGADVPGGGAA